MVFTPNKNMQGPVHQRLGKIHWWFTNESDGDNAQVITELMKNFDLLITLQIEERGQGTGDR